MLEEAIKKLAQGPNFAAFTTLDETGAPTTQMMWVDADDECVLINTEVHRYKFKNVKGDQRVALAIVDKDNPYHYAEVRGDVVDTVSGAEARSHIDHLAHKYTGQDYDASAIQSERVILRIRPRRQRMQ